MTNAEQNDITAMLAQIERADFKRTIAQFGAKLSELVLSRDILTVLKRRYPNAQIVIRPARVQGEGAANDIARGLAAITRLDEVDVVIVGRGGGSIYDLWAFNV